MQLPENITIEEYAARRQRVLAQMLPNSIAIVPAAREQLRNGDSTYPFCQDSDFYYLTGFEEPDAILVLLKEKERAIVFSTANTPKIRQWQGPRLGDRLLQQGIDEWQDLEKWPAALAKLLFNRQWLYYALGLHAAVDQQMLQALAGLRQERPQEPWLGIQDLKPLMADLRVIKSPAELALLAYAGQVSARAQRNLMQHCRPGLFEYQLAARFLADCLAAGCQAMAYPPIVGGGANACILHYTQNQTQLCAGDLVLVDAGAEYAHYAADITRTFPVNGRFTAEQRVLYEVVLNAQTQAMALIKPGLQWTQVQTLIVAQLVQGLLAAGIIRGSAEEWISSKRYHAFYMHGSGHWLGLDVHDVGAYTGKGGASRLLQPNMVLTIEPGIYFDQDCPEVDPTWRGMGIRIEDDVVVTETGQHCLSSEVPKTIMDIEACMASA